MHFVRRDERKDEREVGELGVRGRGTHAARSNLPKTFLSLNVKPSRLAEEPHNATSGSAEADVNGRLSLHPESADRSAEAFDTESLVDTGVEHDAERIVNFPRAERLRAGPVHARAPQPIPAPGRRKPKPGSASEPPTKLYRSQRNDLVVDVIIYGLVSLLLWRRRVEKEQHFEIHFGLERSPRNDPGEPETEPQNEPRPERLESAEHRGRRQSPDPESCATRRHDRGEDRDDSVSKVDG